MGLATAGQLHLVEMGDTFRMMTRGQTFTSYVTVIERNGATRIDKRGIFMFFNKCTHRRTDHSTAQLSTPTAH